MTQKLYALDAFFIEKLKLSENDPYMFHDTTYNRKGTRENNLAILNRDSLCKWLALFTMKSVLVFEHFVCAKLAFIFLDVSLK